tara:strand:- start:637 stop:1266 length:630 start_codon:yes stop_codon:yes gene_type:complete
MKKEKIILVLNGQIPKKDELKSFIKEYNQIICADGAANEIIKLNIHPNFILGDIDSLQTDFIKKRSHIIKLEDQKLNDFQKTLNWLKDKNYTSIDIIGMDGKRIDHTIGNFSIILKELSDFDFTIFTESGIFYTIKNKINFKDVCNRYFSIFSPKKDTKITTLGLKYELKNKTLNHLHKGTLNFANKNEVEIEANRKILVFISNEIKKK